MKATKYTSAVSAVALLLGMASCNDDDFKYEVGEPVPATSVSPYFPTDLATTYSFSPDDDLMVELPIYRMNPQGSVSFPLVVSSDSEGFAFPTEVSFADGQAVDTVKVDCSQLPRKTLCNFSITFPAEQLDPYVEGYTTFEASVIVSTWTLFGTDVTGDLDGKPFVNGEIYYLEGSRQFKIENFVNSGIDLFLELPAQYTEPWGTNMGNVYDVRPTKNYWSQVLDDGSSWWYLCNDAADTDEDAWPIWSIDGTGSNLLDYFQMMDDADYTYWAPYYPASSGNICYGYLSGWTWLDWDDGSSNGAYINLYFTALFNPLPTEMKY